MTIRYEVTKTLRKIIHKEAKPTDVVYCFIKECKAIKYDGMWMDYRNLTERERDCCSSGLCPECFNWVKLYNHRKRNQIVNPIDKNRMALSSFL